jgi:hypothetical protein
LTKGFDRCYKSISIKLSSCKVKEKRTKKAKDMKGAFGGALKCNSLLWENMTDYCERLIPSAGQKSLIRRFDMKKISICIGVFMVLFLAVGVYTAHAQVTGLNGTWLKFTGKFKGMEFSGGPGSTETGRNDNDSIKLYGCVVDGPYYYDNQFFVQLYEKDKNAIRAGDAVFQKSAGTEDKFAGWLNMKLMESYNPLNPDEYTTSVSAPGEMTIKNDKINFKGFGGQAEKEPARTYTGYALYGVKKLDAKTATAKSLPFDEATACPAGNIIQVKVTDDGVGTGIITPAGPWVPVASNVVQEFTIIPSFDVCTFFNVYEDGNTTTPTYRRLDCLVPGQSYTIPLSPAGVNHSIWVEFYNP